MRCEACWGRCTDHHGQNDRSMIDESFSCVGAHSQCDCCAFPCAVLWCDGEYCLSVSAVRVAERSLFTPFRDFSTTLSSFTLSLYASCNQDRKGGALKHHLDDKVILLVKGCHVKMKQLGLLLQADDQVGGIKASITLQGHRKEQRDQAAPSPHLLDHPVFERLQE